MPGADLLLVDNDATLADLVAWALRRAGHEVRTARSFTEARTALAERVPDLLLSDVDLGAESALEELPRLAAAGALPPTLVVSGYLDPAARERLGALAEVRGFLDKPFDPRDLEARVSETLEGLGRASAAGYGAPDSALDGEEEVEDEDGWIEIGGPEEGR